MTTNPTYLQRTTPQERGDQIIAAAAAAGRPFSANDLRSKFIDAGVLPALRGACFHRAIAAGLIEPVADVPSGSPGTHGKRIALYAAVKAGRS